MATKGILLNDIKKFCVAHTTSESDPIRSLDFLYSGELMLYNTEDKINFLTLENSHVGEKSIKVQQYGAGVVKFFSPDYVVHSSLKKDDNLRLLNYEDVSKPRYVRYFTGHSDLVASLSISSDLIASGSKDKSIRLWNPLQQKSVYRKEFPSTPLVAFHPSTAIIAVAYNSSTIEIFTTKQLTESIRKAEFEVIPGVQWTGLKFSDNGEMLMITTNSTSIRIFNAVKLEELHNFRDYTNPESIAMDACFDPESSFVFGGSFQGDVHVWDLKTSSKVYSLKSGYGPCYNVAFNPKFMNIATSGKNVHLWIERLVY